MDKYKRIRHKSHRAALTSIQSYKELKQQGKDVTERQYIRRLLAKTQPATSRKLSEVSGIERTNINRCIYDLRDQDIVEVLKKDQCPVTGKLVEHYRIKGFD